MAQDTQTLAITNFAAGPHRGSKPAFLSSLVDASKRYLQTFDTFFLQQAVKLVTPEVCSLGYFDDMIRTEPMIAQGIDILYMAGSNNQIRPNPTESSFAKNNPELARAASRYIDLMYASMSNDYELVRQKVNYDTLVYGEGFAELQWGAGAGRLDGYSTITGIEPVQLKSVITVIDNANRIVGYAPYGIPGISAPLGTWLPLSSLMSQVMESYEESKRESILFDTKYLPPWKVLHQQWMPMSDPRVIKRLLEPAKQAWFAKQQVLAVLLTLIDASPGYIQGETAEGAEDVCLRDPQGTPLLDSNGMEIRCSPEEHLRAQLETARGGGINVGVSGVKTGYVQPSHEMINAVITAAEFFNSEMSVAVLHQFLASGQGARGSEEGVKSHSSILSLLISHFCSRQSSAFYHQVHRPAVAAAFGKDALPYTPDADLGSYGMPYTPEQIGLLQQSGFFAPDQMADLDRGLGFSPRQQADIVLPTAMRNDAQSLADRLMVQMGNRNQATLRFEE